VVFLPLVLLCDYARGRWKPILRYGWIAGVTLLYLGVFWKLQGGHFGSQSIASLDNPLVDLSARWRILNALRVAWKYVALQIYPGSLSCDYSFNQIPVYSDWSHTLPAAAAAAAALAAWVWALRKRHTGLMLAGGIYLISFAVTANVLTPIGTIMGERLAYLPSAGICLLVAMGWVWALGYCRQDRQRMLAFGLLATAVLALGVRTVVRNFDWKNNRTLFASALNAAPESAKVLANIGDLHRAEGQLDLAQAEYQKALKIYPNYPNVLESAGLLEFKLGHLQTAGQMMEKALFTSDRNNINYDFMAVNLAALYVQTNHIDGALDLLNREIAQAPEYDRAWSNRAVIHYKLHNTNGARTDAEAALRLDPGNAQAQNVIHLLNTSSAQ
jgi:tetratricopeptide (TPR) repeat protein